MFAIEPDALPETIAVGGIKDGARQQERVARLLRIVSKVEQRKDQQNTKRRERQPRDTLPLAQPRTTMPNQNEHYRTATQQNRAELTRKEHTARADRRQDEIALPVVLIKPQEKQQEIHAEKQGYRMAEIRGGEVEIER